MKLINNITIFLGLSLLLVSCTNAEKLTLEGDKSFEQKNYDEALDFYNQAIEKDADYIYAYAGKASVYFHTKNHDSALEENLKLINLCEKAGNFRDLATAHQQRCLIYADKGDYENSLTEITKAIEIYEKQNIRVRLGFAYKMRSAVYQKLGEKEKSSEDRKISDKYFYE